MFRIVCSICYDFVSSECILSNLDCGHIYHANCLSQWIKTSQTCPECRKKFTKPPSRVYPNFDVNDETLQLTNNIGVLENENKKLNAILAEKTYEVMNVTNAFTSLDNLYTESVRTNNELTERLVLCHGSLNSACELLSSQRNESTILTSRITDLEKQLQFAEGNAQMDKYFKTVAINEKDVVIGQLNDTQRQLCYAQNTIDRNVVQIETILCELNTMRTEKQMQMMRIKKMEQMIRERDTGRKGIEMENVQLKSKLKEIMSPKVGSISAVERKRNFADCSSVDLVNDNIKQVLRPNSIVTTEPDHHPPIKLIIRKMKRGSNFACLLVR